MTSLVTTGGSRIAMEEEAEPINTDLVLYWWWVPDACTCWQPLRDGGGGGAGAGGGRAGEKTGSVMDQ